MRDLPFSEISYQGALLRGTLFIYTEAVWLSWEVFIDAIYLSASVISFIWETFSQFWTGEVNPKYCVQMFPGGGRLRIKPQCLLRCRSPWASHELCVWPLWLTFWTDFQKKWFFCSFFLVSVAVLIADYSWWGPKTLFLYSKFSHFWMMSCQEVLWFCI